MPRLFGCFGLDIFGHELLTRDGVRLSARHEPVAGSSFAGSSFAGSSFAGSSFAGQTADGLAFIVAHGFTGSRRTSGIRTVVDGLHQVGGAVSFDFRGHGRSGGVSTVGDLEIEDLEAAVTWARELGYPKVVTVGWSMGAAVAIRHAALLRGVDAVVAVSAPSRWYYRGTRAMRLVHRAIESRSGRVATACCYGTRVARSGWDPPPRPPDAVVGLIAPTPLLIVHGDADRFFPVDHACWLAAAARQPSELWLERGFGHAEAAATPELVARIATWARAAIATTPNPAAVDAERSARMRG